MSSPISSAENGEVQQAWQEGYRQGIVKGQKDQAIHEKYYLIGFRTAEAVYKRDTTVMPIRIPVFSVLYSDYEVSNLRLSYHLTKSGAYRAMREYIINDYERTMKHIQVRGYKKERGQKWYRDHFKISVISDTIRIEN